MSVKLRFVWAAGFASALFAAGPAFSKDVCNRDVAAKMSTATEFCSCDTFSREAILLLESKREEAWFANGVRRQCPVRASFVMNGLRLVASSESRPKPVLRTQSGGGSDTVTASGDATPTSTLAGSDPAPTDPDPNAPIPPAPPSSEPNPSEPPSVGPGTGDDGKKDHDDNGHGNDPDRVDDSNPGLKL